MIREYKEKDIDSIVGIWLEASIKAHSFVPEEFWKNKVEDMRNIYIPNSETWVFDKNGEIEGFFSLYQNTLAAIFVDPRYQSKGFGKELIRKAKSLRSLLTLTVYSENIDSVEFYKKQDFTIIKEQIDKHTNRNELVMQWNT
ncbi:N-acetyltransferase [Campylobacterota bacterium DY0563]